VEKKIFRKPRWRLNLLFYFKPPSWFSENYFSRNYKSYFRQTNTIDRLKKKIKILRFILKSDFNPPSLIDPPFLTKLTKYDFGSCFWSKFKLIAKARTEKCWQILKIFYFLVLPPSWTPDAILNPTKTFLP
jgi:hypothetical protein